MNPAVRPTESGENFTATAYSRAGLLGNPSDGFGGRVLSVTLANFSATVRVTRSKTITLAANTDDEWRGASWQEVAQALEAGQLQEGAGLIGAAALQLLNKLSPNSPPKAEVSFVTTVPRQVGLSGSSAIVIAALRALAPLLGVRLDRLEIARLALDAEQEGLGISAGPQDRVVQSYEGVMDMDFSEPWNPDLYRRVDPVLVPPLFVAWDPALGESSTIAHENVRERWERGDEQVRAVIARFPELVAEGIECLRSNDRRGFLDLVNQNFDLRASIWKISERDREMVELGRNLGAGVKFSGSGGAVLGALFAVDDFPAIETAYSAYGFQIAPVEIRVPEDWAPVQGEPGS